MNKNLNLAKKVRKSYLFMLSHVLFIPVYIIILSVSNDFYYGVNLIFILLALFTIFYFYRLVDLDKNKLLNQINNTNLTIVPEKEDSGIYEFIYSLNRQINPLFDSKVKVWKSRVCQYFPSIQYDERFNTLHLILPFNYINLYFTNRKEAKALMAHELCHLKQEDVFLWTFSSIYINSFQKVFKQSIIITVILDISFIVVSGFISTFSFDFLCGIIICFSSIYFIRYFFWMNVVKTINNIVEEINLGRIQAEELADIGAIIYADGESLLSVCEKYLVDNSDGFHLPKKERINWIKKAMNNKIVWNI